MKLNKYSVEKSNVRRIMLVLKPFLMEAYIFTVFLIAFRLNAKVEPSYCTIFTT